tara:strand:- start:2454 stop:2630 length:177 start_codon:yes stop_codon:yes gene_type:complete
MADNVRSTINMFSQEGLGARAERYLRRYPDSVECLTENELREQILTHPDAKPPEQRLN